MSLHTAMYIHIYIFDIPNDIVAFICDCVARDTIQTLLIDFISGSYTSLTFWTRYDIFNTIPNIRSNVQSYRQQQI